MPPETNTVTMTHADTGRAIDVPVEQIEEAARAGYVVEGAEQRVARLSQERIAEENAGVTGALKAGTAGFLRGASLGLSDVGFAALGGEDAARDLRELREARPGASLVGEVVGAVVPGGGGTLAAKAGESVAGRIAGEGLVRTAARKAAKGAVEGGIQGLGTGVTELALSDDPLTVERIASTLGTGALLGAGVGSGFELAGAGLHGALSKTSKKLREFADATPQIVEAPPATFPGAPALGELPPPKLTKSGEPSKRSPGVVREMRVGDLQDVKSARLRELRKEGKLVDTMERVESAQTARIEAVNSKGKLPAAHGLNKPIDIIRGEDGSLKLTDGYVRLSSLPHDAKIKVRFRSGDATGGAKPPATADNFANLDARGLREARQAELDAIEAARVADRPVVADEISAHRKQAQSDKLFLATESVRPPGTKGKRGPPLTDEMRELATVRKIHIEADKALDKHLRNPKELAENPGKALSALRQEEHALEQIVDIAQRLPAAEGARAQALAAIPKALQRNRALQQRLGELYGPATSKRLAALDEAKERLADRLATADQGSGALGALGVAATFAAPLPVVGGAVVAASTMVGRVAQKTRKALGFVADKTSRTIDKILDVSAKARPATRAIPVIATRVLAKARYGGADTDEPETKSKGAKPQRLAELYKKRSAELRSLTMLGPDGMPMMRREARARVASQLSAFAAFDPLLADKIETLTARRVEFLAGRLPRRPDLAALQTGPDRWQPSDMQMRTWARYVAAVEDPGAIEERLVDGSITPEDAEVMREVYPERMEALKAELLARLPQLQRQLPYHRRLALSIFSGVPVDPAMNPQILRVLQASFADEPGSEGGTMAPQASPAFGSVRSQEKPTRAQQRAGT